MLLVIAIALVGALAVNAPGGQAASRASATATAPRLVGIRAAHHPGFDRVVFQFTGALPSRRQVRYVDRLIGDPSGRGVRVAGRAILEASFFPTVAHNSTGQVTAPGRVAFALPTVTTVVRLGDFEVVLSYGIGLAKRTSFHVSTLARPSRVLIDIRTTFRTVLRKVYFENPPRFAVGTQPFVTQVLRPVLLGAPATGAMDRLFAGPTASEYAAGLRLQLSGASGLQGLAIHAPIARVKLTDGCSSGGSTFSIADEI